MDGIMDERLGFLSKMRAQLLEVGSQSETSIKYQDALARFVFENGEKGGAIIEVGCYKGGLTAQLAFMAKVRGSHLYTIDIAPEWISHTQDLLGKFNLNTHTRYYCGTFDNFAANTLFQERPLLLIIDGDHRYEFVLEDIKSIYKLKKIPYGVAFHDFSLRYVHTYNIFVDKAIIDSFGPDIELIRIGEQVDETECMPKKNNPDPKDGGFYWEEHGSKGVIMFPPSLLPNCGREISEHLCLSNTAEEPVR
jgi:hypothetical protein